jgi:tetratricopeptide (TPR) repeat protein
MGEPSPQGRGAGRRRPGRRLAPVCRRFLLLAAPLLAAWVTHGSYLDGGFTWLDRGDIEQGRAVVPLGEIATAFHARFGNSGFFRPLVTVAHSLDARAHGLEPAGYHRTNVLLQVAVTAAVLGFGLAFFRLSVAEAALAATIAAVHPLSWLPVGAISYRPELLVTLWSLLAAALYARSRRAGRPPWLAALSFLAALLSKETALAWVPALLVCWELGWTGGPGPAAKRLWQRRWPGLALMAAAVAIYLPLRWLAVPEGWGLSPAPLAGAEAAGTRLAVVGKRLAELLSLQPPTLSDAAPVVSPADPWAAGTLLAAAAAAWIVLRRGLRDPLSQGLLVLAVALSPAANLLPLPRFSSPHYGYFALPAVGALAALAWRASRRASRLVRIAVALLLGCWAAAMAAGTYSGGHRFADDRVLFEPEVARDPGFREGWHYLGGFYLERGELEKAAAALENALRVDPGRLAFVDVPAARIDLALTRWRQGRLDEADALLARAEGEAPRSMLLLIRYDRALVAVARGEAERVAQLLGGLAPPGEAPEPEALLERARRALQVRSREPRKGRAP